MKHFTSIHDVDDPQNLVQQVVDLKRKPVPSSIGNHKTLGLVFFNPSLRTRLSTQKAGENLGMDVMVLNISEDAWNVEFEDAAVMNGSNQEHIKDAVRVISGYCDIIGVRTFAGLEDREKDYAEDVLSNFVKYSSVPVISLESATLHPLQSLTDLATIADQSIDKPKIAVSWAPHPKQLPQAVTNSFLQWIRHTNANVCLAHPKGYELNKEFTNAVKTTNDQSAALEDADFVYVKNWSSYANYGQMPSVEGNWMMNQEKINLTDDGRFMHCLPIRRNVVATDDVIDNSLVYKQAKNREYAAQIVLKNLLEDI